MWSCSMSSQDLQKLVEEIVQRVLQRIENDVDLSRLLDGEDADAKKETPTLMAARGANGIGSTAVTNQTPEKRLYTERDILEFSGSGGKELVVTRNTIFTPLALDAARRKGVAIRKSNK